MIKEVEVEKVVEVERVVEVPVEREVVREIVREVPVDRVVEVEKLVGMREEEVEAMKQALQVQAEQERQRLLDTNLLSAEENARQVRARHRYHHLHLSPPPLTTTSSLYSTPC